MQICTFLDDLRRESDAILMTKLIGTHGRSL